MKSVQLSRPQNRSECSICLLNFECGLFANNTNEITGTNSRSRVEAICTFAVFFKIQMFNPFFFHLIQNKFTYTSNAT